MRQTFTTLKTDFFDSISLSGSTDATLTAFFTRHLGEKYQLMFGVMQNYVTQDQKTDVTVATQQYYKYQPGTQQLENVTITVGSIAYPLICISSQQEWDRLNQTLIQSTTIPQFFFPRRDDFGIWPIPQAAYTITENRLLRDRNLTNKDYTTGTVSVTNGSATVMGTTTVFTDAMVGRWFQVTTDGYWYRILSRASNTSITLNRTYMGTTGSSLSFVIGESPELPEEGHEILSWGVLADYYGLIKKDVDAETRFNNKFFTGDPQNPERDGRNIIGGLIGLRNRYSARSNNKIIYGKRHGDPFNNYLWSQTISS